MSLYDGLGIGEKEVGSQDKTSDLAGWTKNSSIHLLQKQLQNKKSGINTSKRLKTSATLAPVVDLKRTGSDIHFNLLTGKAEAVPAIQPASGVSAFIDSTLNASFLGVVDEYNPLRPNEYEEFSRKQKEQRMREKEERRLRDEEDLRRSDRVRGSPRRPHSSDSDSNSADEEEEKRRRMNQMNKAAIAPPRALIEQDKQEEPAQPDLPVKKAKFGNVSVVAAKIMEKMGYRQGSGLGAKEQGMSRALEVEKTSRRGGRILHEKDITKIPDPMLQQEGDMMDDGSPMMQPPQQPPDLKNPTKIVLLRNMVGPGEVDEDLEPETAEECSKYGKVIKCVIYEIPDATPEEAVRIFLEFEKVDASIKAIIDLNGRFFGGRAVRANFYDPDRFRQLDLAADPL